MQTLDLGGLIPATLTPLTAAYEVDEAALRRYIQWLLQFDGLKACAVNMDTGEGPHLMREEKKRILTIWKEEAGNRLPILAGISGPSRQMQFWKRGMPMKPAPTAWSFSQSLPMPDNRFRSKFH